MTNTTTTKAAPRLTVKQLHDSVEKKFDEYDELHKAHAEMTSTLDRDLRVNEFKTGELQRKTGGITRANAEAAALKLRVQALESKLSDDVDPLIREKAFSELERIERRLETLFGELSEDYGILKGIVDEHTGLLAEHDSRIDEAKLGADMANEGVSSLNGRVSTIESGTKFPLLRFIVAAIIGVIVGLIWNGIDFVQTEKLPDGSNFTIDYPFANSGWAAIIAGLAAFGIAFGLMLLLGRHDNIEVVQGERTTFWQRTTRHLPQTRNQQSPHSTPTVPQAPSRETMAVSDAPTEVIPTSTGASSAR